MKQGVQKFLNRIFEKMAKRYPIGFWVGVSWQFSGSTVEYVPQEGSQLRIDDSSIRLIVDSTIFPFTFAKGHWQFGDVEIILNKRDPGKKYIFVDIGANIGLFTRQIAIAAGDTIQHFVCVEPESTNFSFLEHNLLPIGDRCTLVNAAISAGDGVAELSIDKNNVGRHSLIRDNSDGNVSVNVEVTLMSGASLSSLVISNDPELGIIVKCDTEGFDEFIMTNLTDEFWDRVNICLVELSPMVKPHVDWVRFESIIRRFPSRVWAHEPETQLEPRDILALSRSLHGKEHDLLLTR